MHRLAAYILLTLGTLFAASAPLASQQGQQDDKVKLLSAQSAHLLEVNGENFRKVIGPAKFFHNNTYLLCDTALWNVNTNIIDAVGNVRIIQDQTQLSSATLQYVVDDNMARFRGSLVQLEDKDKNILRTRYLDYNTKDSVAIFQGGGAMRDTDGQVIESLYGTYDSKARLFVFNDQVNMYLDTTFVKTSRLEYRSDLSTAYFGYGTDMWQDDKMLSAHDGWYDRGRELFFFRRKVHVLTKDQETWADTLYYYRDIKDADLRGNVEIMDTTRNVYALAGRFQYMDSLSQVRMTREPAVMSVSDEKGVRDTLYVGADTLLMRGIQRCDVPEPWIKDAEKRLGDVSGDPIMEYRRKAAEEAAKAAEEAAKNDPNRPPDPPNKGKGAKEVSKEEPPEPPEPPAAQPDSLAVLPQLDSLAVKPQLDSLAALPQLDSLKAAPTDSLKAALPALDSLKSAPRDSLKALQEKKLDLPDSLGGGAAPPDSIAPPKDTTKVNFIWGHKRVRLFRRKMQMSADSLMYTDLDSLVRVYQNPIFFSDGNRQYAADSIYMVIKDKQMQKAHLLSNAFITIEEAPKSYDQIRGAEMVAYFDSTSSLTRFDALGGASSIFYLEENGALATVNKVDAKMMYAIFQDGELDRIHYYENPKNDGYPSVQMPEDERTLKGFRWEPEKRPSSPRDVTSLVPRPSERLSYLARPHTEFKQTQDYFPGHIKKIYREIAIRDSLQVVRERKRNRERDSLARAAADTLSLADSLAVPRDSLKGVLDSLKTPLDSLKVPLDSLRGALDSLAVAADSLSTAPADSSLTAPSPQLTEKEIKAREKAERDAQKEREKQERQAAREAKWAEEDRIYEEKQAAKAQRKLDKERAKKLKLLRKLEKKAQRERLLFERYLERERKRELKLKNISE